MGRYIGPRCRLCRREGYSVCGCKKCALARRDRPPGIPHFGARKQTDYAVHLREKQKVKRIYGLLERQFRRFFAQADRMKGNTGETLLVLLERRLDNVVFRAGFAPTRRFARQLVTHGHVMVGGQRVDRPGYLVNPGEVIQGMREKGTNLFKANFEQTKGRTAPSWLAVEDAEARVKVIGLPPRAEIQDPINEQLIVEFCSR